MVYPSFLVESSQGNQGIFQNTGDNASGGSMPAAY